MIIIQQSLIYKINEGGGTWFTSSFSAGTHYTQSFTKATNNLDVPVTEYVNEWINGTRANNGFIIKKSKADENSTTKFGSIKFFSSDTHTIYPPVLETRWDDSSFVTGSLGQIAFNSFKNDPQVYITSVGLYNDRRELLAVAKLSQPLLKNYTREALIKVKLDF